MKQFPVNLPQRVGQNPGTAPVFWGKKISPLQREMEIFGGAPLTWELAGPCGTSPLPARSGERIPPSKSSRIGPLNRSSSRRKEALISLSPRSLSLLTSAATNEGVHGEDQGEGAIPIGYLPLSRPRRGQLLRTNSLPGSCLTSRFISRLSNTTETVEAVKPLPRINSSMGVSSRLNAS